MPCIFIFIIMFSVPFIAQLTFWMRGFFSTWCIPVSALRISKFVSAAAVTVRVFLWRTNRDNERLLLRNQAKSDPGGKHKFYWAVSPIAIQKDFNFYRSYHSYSLSSRTGTGSEVSSVHVIPVLWIRIRMGPHSAVIWLCWIRIHTGNANPDPNPGAWKLTKIKQINLVSPCRRHTCDKNRLLYLLRFDFLRITYFKYKKIQHFVNRIRTRDRISRSALVLQIHNTGGWIPWYPRWRPRRCAAPKASCFPAPAKTSTVKCCLDLGSK